MAVVRLENSESKEVNRFEDSLSADLLLSKVANDGIRDKKPDVYSIAEYLGLEVSEEIMDKDMSGYLEFRNNRWVAGVNILHHPNRRRFSLAHEIGHFLLHRNKEFRDSGEMFTRKEGRYSDEETQANSFAAELLMPEVEVREAIKRGLKNISELAEKFEVSFAAMKIRVEELGFKVK